MKTPETVRVGGIDYAVVETKGLNNGAQMLYGRIDYQKSIIELNPEVQAHQMKCVTLWHEIIHGIIEHSCINIKESTEEVIIDMIAKGVYQVLQDNSGNFFDLCKGNAS